MTIFKKLIQLFNLRYKNKPVSFLYAFDCLLILLIIFLGFQLYLPVGSKNLLVRSEEKTEEMENPKLGVANPAAIYCQGMGYDYQIVTEADGSQHGNCIFSEGISCGDWDFYRGKCGQEYSYCVKNGYDLIASADGKDPYSFEYSTCVSKDDRKALGSVTKLMDLVSKSTKGRSSFQERELNNSDEVEIVSPKTVSGLLANPSSFSWRNYDGSNWVTSVKNQGSCGSCWAHSAVGVVEALYNIATGDPTYDLNLSEQYHTAGCDNPDFCSGCCGGWNDIALGLIRDNGVPDEACMPYVDTSSCTCDGGTCDTNCTYRTGDYCSDATCSNRCSDWSTRLTQISAMGTTADIGVPANIETMKADLIEQGPLSIAFDSTNGEWYYDDTMENIVYGCNSPVVADHAVIVVGYDDNHGDDGFWIVKNSWGDTWGWEEDGYFKVFYGNCLIEESGVYYAEPTEYKFYIQNSSGVNKASISSFGNIVLDGTCISGGTCSAPTNSFIIQNNAGGTVGYIDSYGNMCIETGTCADQSLSCDSPSEGAFIIQNMAGENVAYIDGTGNLCLTGILTESGNP